MNDYILDRSIPPKPAPITKVAFPEFDRSAIGNGLDVWTVPNHEQSIVSLSLFLRAGSAYDPRNREGLASTVADLLTKGTVRRSATQIAEEIDFVGGSLSASAGWDALTINVSVLSKYLDLAIDLLSDVIQASTFPEEEIERMRLQRLAGLRQAKADAGFLADLAFSKLVFPGHPYGQQPMGTDRSIAETNRNDITRFAKEYITPANAFMVAAGDIDSERLCKLLDRNLSTWSGQPSSKIQSGDASLSRGLPSGTYQSGGCSTIRASRRACRNCSNESGFYPALCVECAIRRLFQFTN